MASWADVTRICTGLPEVEEATSGGGARQWRVRGKAFVFERPLRRGDLRELGDAAPSGNVLAAYVPDEGAKSALVSDEPDVYFTTSHFDGYPVVLCRLERLGQQALLELAGEAWACRAPRRLVARTPLPGDGGGKP